MLPGDIIPLAPAHSCTQHFNNTLQGKENSAHGLLFTSAGSVSGLCFSKTEAKPFVLASSRQQLWSPLFWSCAGCVNTGTKRAVLPNSRLIFGSRYGWDSLTHCRRPATPLSFCFGNSVKTSPPPPTPFGLFVYLFGRAPMVCSRYLRYHTTTGPVGKPSKFQCQCGAARD